MGPRHTAYWAAATGTFRYVAMEFTVVHSGGWSRRDRDIV